MAWTGYQVFDMNSDQPFALALEGESCLKCNAAPAAFLGHFAVMCRAGHTFCGPCCGFLTLHQAMHPKRPLQCAACLALRRAASTGRGQPPPPPPPPPPSVDRRGSGRQGGAPSELAPPPDEHGSAGSQDRPSWRGGRRRSGLTPGRSTRRVPHGTRAGAGCTACRAQHVIGLQTPAAHGAWNTLTRDFLARWTIEPD